MALNKTLYTAEITNTGGRNGHITSSDNILDFDVSMPAEMGGSAGHTNPEQLFAAAYAACFGGALGAVADGRDISDFRITARVSIGKDEAGGYGLAAELDVHLPKLERSEAQKLVEDANAACPYSKATRGNIDVQVKAV